MSDEKPFSTFYMRMLPLLLGDARKELLVEQTNMFGSLLHWISLTCDSFPQRGVGKVKMVRFLNLEQLGSFEQLALGVSA